MDNIFPRNLNNGVLKSTEREGDLSLLKAKY